MKLWGKVKLFRVIASAGIEDSDASVKSAGVQRSNSKAENTESAENALFAGFLGIKQER